MSDKTEPWKWGDENQPKPTEPPHIEGQRHLCCGYDAYMRPFAHGNWVAYEDYARLKAEVEAYRSASDEVAAAFLALPTPHNQVARVCEGIESLKAEVERLNEAILLGAIIPDAKPE